MCPCHYEGTKYLELFSRWHQIIHHYLGQNTADYNAQTVEILKNAVKITTPIASSAIELSIDEKKKRAAFHSGTN